VPRYIAGSIAVAVLVVIQTFIEWLHRKVEPPIMRKRVNEGSDEYLDERGSPLDEGIRRVRDR
jgi:hypothetical protein